MIRVVANYILLICWFLPSLILSTSPAPVGAEQIVSLIKDSGGYFTTDASVSSVMDGTHVFRITFSSEVTLNTPDPWELPGQWDTSTEICFTRWNPHRLRFMVDPLYLGPGGSAYLGIGHRSAFLNRFRSVAFIQNSYVPHRAGMIVGSQLESFLETCQSQSLIGINTDAQGVFNVSVRFGQDNYLVLRPAKLMHSDRNVLGLHLPALERLFSLIEITGARVRRPSAAAPGDILITNCTRELVESNPTTISSSSSSVVLLPNINLGIGDGHRITLAPPDYIEISDDYATRRECRLMIGLSGETQFSFSPLLVPDLNVRISSEPSTIHFCDTNRHRT